MFGSSQVLEARALAYARNDDLYRVGGNARNHVARVFARGEAVEANHLHWHFTGRGGRNPFTVRGLTSGRAAGSGYWIL